MHLRGLGIKGQGQHHQLQQGRPADQVGGGLGVVHVPARTRAGAVGWVGNWRATTQERGRCLPAPRCHSCLHGALVCGKITSIHPACAFCRSHPHLLQLGTRLPEGSGKPAKGVKALPDGKGFVKDGVTYRSAVWHGRQALLNLLMLLLQMLPLRVLVLLLLLRVHTGKLLRLLFVDALLHILPTSAASTQSPWRPARTPHPTASPAPHPSPPNRTQGGRLPVCRARGV